MLRLLLTISLILLTSTVYASIGNVVKQKGNASVERLGSKSVLTRGSDIEFKDNVRTGNGNVGIKFVDDTNVAVSPHSSLIIDEFIYDPNSRSGSKLVMNIGEAFHAPAINGKGVTSRDARQDNADLVMRKIAKLIPENHRGYYG